ncbi:rRNA-processing protein bfr2 [Sorochytrium milnesiophthora]
MAKSSSTKRKTLAQQLADLNSGSTAPAEFDPEAFHPRPADRDENDNDDDSASDNDSDAGREHYVQVGESELRKQANRKLVILADSDARYAGRSTSRRDIFQSFLGSSDLEELAEEDEESGDDEQNSEQDQDQAELEDDDDDDNESEQEGDAMSLDGDDDDDDDDQESAEEGDDALARELRKMQQDESQMVRAMTEAARTEEDKSRHVKQQMAIWDQLLDLRIRLQKAVTVANQAPRSDVLPTFVNDSTTGVEESSRISELLGDVQKELVTAMQRLVKVQCDKMAPAHPDVRKVAAKSTKRSYDDMTADELWTAEQQFLAGFRSFRDTSLDKWHDQVHGTDMSNKFKAINQTTSHQIATVMNDRERLLRRTQLKRAPVRLLGDQPTAYTSGGKASKKSADAVAGQEKHEDPAEREEEMLTLKQRRSALKEAEYDAEIFDDTDFYQSLLRELIERKMSDDKTTDTTALHMATLKGQQRKHRKGPHGNDVVDTKASKGRKIRFDVHDKLQHFMAPIPTQLPAPTMGVWRVSAWPETMVDELYSGLFGASATAAASASASASAATANPDVASLPADVEPLRLFA